MIDVDFGPVNVSIGRDVASFEPTTLGVTGNGISQIIAPLNAGAPSGTINGSFIQYARIDLEFMTMNNEVMQPMEVSIQRTSPVPLGFHINGNNHDQMEEYIYILTRPLNNQSLNSNFNVENLRDLGLDRSVDTGNHRPTHTQTVYAEKRMYSYSDAIGATRTNGALQPDPLLNTEYNTMYGMPILDSVSTWGTLSAITGPNLHAYRVVIMRNQVFSPAQPDLFVNVDGLAGLVGSTSCNWPPVNITFLCKDPNFTEGEYLTRLANAMNDVPIGGETA